MRRLLVLAIACSDATKEPPKPEPPTPAVPQKQSHPEYPTPLAAGTEKIFTLEDPDRGPLPPSSFALPDDIRWTLHDHCEVEVIGFACGPEVRRPAGKWHWRVGKTRDLVVIDKMLSQRSMQRYVQSVAEQLHIDTYGTVRVAHRIDGDRYSGRERDGSNYLDGCGAMGFLLDDKRIAERRCLQWLGQPMHDTNGVAVTKYTRDARGFVTLQQFFDIDGKPRRNVDGVAQIAYQRDAHGRPLRTTYRDETGTALRSAKGCYAFATEWVENAVAKDTCLDQDGRATPAVSRVETTLRLYDTRGCAAGVRYYLGSKPVANHDGVYGIENIADAQCTITSSTCIDVKWQRAACGPGKPARTLYRHDAIGQVIARSAYKADLTPGEDPTYHVFELRYRYDDRGRGVSDSCWGPLGAPSDCYTMGYHEKRVERDDAGRNVKETYFAIDGKRASNVGGFTTRVRYDNYDHMHEARYFGATDERVSPLGAHVQRFLWDAMHRRFAVLLLDEESKPTNILGCLGGATCPRVPWHAIRIARRSDGTVEKNLFFDADAQLVDTVDCTLSGCLD